MVAWSVHVQTIFDFAEQAAPALVQDCNSVTGDQAQAEDWVEEQQMSLVQEDKIALPLGIVVQASSSRNRWDN